MGVNEVLFVLNSLVRKRQPGCIFCTITLRGIERKLAWGDGCWMRYRLTSLRHKLPPMKDGMGWELYCILLLLGSRDSGVRSNRTGLDENKIGF